MPNSRMFASTTLASAFSLPLRCFSSISHTLATLRCRTISGFTSQRRTPFERRSGSKIAHRKVWVSSSSASVAATIKGFGVFVSHGLPPVRIDFPDQPAGPAKHPLGWWHCDQTHNRPAVPAENHLIPRSARFTSSERLFLAWYMLTSIAFILANRSGQNNQPTATNLRNIGVLQAE
jgi:hypothetical protein